jgi:hypothetical protein
LEETLKLAEELPKILELALPNRKHGPTCLSQSGLLGAIALFVGFNLLPPESASGFWEACEATAVVSMPEATMDKNSLPAAWKDNVWGTG